MGKPPQKITRSILAYGNLNIKLHVRVSAENLKYHNEFEFKEKKYLSLGNNVYITMEINNKNEEWNSGNGVMLNQYNIHQVIKAMKKVIKSMYDEPIFGKKKNGELVVYKDEAKKHIEQVNLLTTNGAILFEPGLIYDENDVTYEGRIIHINRTGNTASIPFEVFEGICYTLEKIDLFQYSQLIMNYFTIYYKDELNDFYNGRSNRTYERKTIDFNKGPQEKTESNFSRNGNEEDILFDGLNGK